jgi:hypothetical protein
MFSAWEMRLSKYGIAGSDLRKTECLVPGFDGAVFSPAWRDALWARFFTAVPTRQRRSVARSSLGRIDNQDSLKV